MNKTIIWLLLLLGFILSSLPICYAWNKDVENYQYEQYIAPYREWQYQEYQRLHPDEPIWYKLQQIDAPVGLFNSYFNPSPHIKVSLFLLTACFWFFFLPNVLGLINYNGIPDIALCVITVFYWWTALLLLIVSIFIAFIIIADLVARFCCIKD